MNSKRLIIIIILAFIGIGLITGAAVYYSKAVREDREESTAVSSSAPDETSADDPSDSENKETTEDISLTEAESEYIPEEEFTDESEEETLKRGGVAPEFKKFWDEYESFMDSYATVLNDKDNPDYRELEEHYKGYVKKAAEYENSEELTAEEVDYMAAAHARISAKYAAAWLGETE